MRVASLAILFCIVLAAPLAGAEREFHRIYQPEISSDGSVGLIEKWREIPSAQAESPKTWVAPFSDSGSQLMPSCSLTKAAGLKVTSVLGKFHPRITIHVSDKSTLKKSVSRLSVLEAMIECIQLNMKIGSFFDIRISTDESVDRKRFAKVEGSYATLRPQT